jgi:G:T/U-mismatch repair DNA glycosylase
MPSTGKVTARAFSKDEEAALEGAAPFLGPDTLDVHLNDSAFWKNVPRAVWEYHLGGYQVIKKWLSYREKAILGRGLKIEEVAHVRDTARRIAALILLGPELDVNYASIHVNGHTWPART